MRGAAQLQRLLERLNDRHDDVDEGRAIPAHADRIRRGVRGRTGVVGARHLSSPRVETTLGCAAADRAVVASPRSGGTGATGGMWGDSTFRQQPSARRAGELQYLGEMPWVSRATAIKPDANQMAQVCAKVNGSGAKKGSGYRPAACLSGSAARRHDFCRGRGDTEIDGLWRTATPMMRDSFVPVGESRLLCTATRVKYPGFEEHAHGAIIP
jgi:hypothetical protein